MTRRLPFDPAGTYVVRRGFRHQGRLLATGTPFDITSMRPHGARILYNAGRLAMVPKEPEVRDAATPRVTVAAVDTTPPAPIFLADAVIRRPAAAMKAKR